MQGRRPSRISDRVMPIIAPHLSTLLATSFRVDCEHSTGDPIPPDRGDLQYPFVSKCLRDLLRISQIKVVVG